MTSGPGSLARVGIVVLAMLVTAAPAHASRLAVAQQEDTDGDDAGQIKDLVVYEAAPGEANVVRLERADGVWTITDTGVGSVDAPAPCTRASATTVTCPVQPDDGAAILMVTRVDLGDGDDRFEVKLDDGAQINQAFGGDGNDTMNATSSRGRTSMYGGLGDDTLIGSDFSYAELADDVLVGGPGNDALMGGRGDDTLIGDDGTTTTNGEDRLDGGGGADTLIGDGPRGAPAADVLSGGKGDDDTVSYEGAQLGVRVSLGGGEPGGAAAGDMIDGFEGIAGGAVDDVLTGDGGANRIVGGAGADTITAGAGDDTLWGESGRDRLLGGAGDDEIVGDDARDVQVGGPGDDLLDAAELSGGQPDDLTCGAGDDAVRDPNRRQRIRSDCEGVQVGELGPIVARAVRVRDGTVTLTVRCPGPILPCERALAARDEGGRLLARRTPKLAKGTHAVALRSTALGRAALGPTLHSLLMSGTPGTLTNASWRAPVRPG